MLNFIMAFYYWHQGWKNDAIQFGKPICNPRSGPMFLLSMKFVCLFCLLSHWDLPNYITPLVVALFVLLQNTWWVRVHWVWSLIMFSPMMKKLLNIEQIFFTRSLFKSKLKKYKMFSPMMKKLFEYRTIFFTKSLFKSKLEIYIMFSPMMKKLIEYRTIFLTKSLFKSKLKIYIMFSPMMNIEQFFSLKVYLNQN